MSTTEEQAECPHEAWEEYGGGSRKCADCGAFLPHASTDTPTPERVTLTDEERASLADAFDHEVEANCWSPDCDAGIWESVECILAAREQALREESWEACWSSIAEAAWPEGGATRSEVLSLVLGARPAGDAR